MSKITATCAGLIGAALLVALVAGGTRREPAAAAPEGPRGVASEVDAPEATPAAAPAPDSPAAPQAERAIERRRPGAPAAAVTVAVASPPPVEEVPGPSEPLESPAIEPAESPAIEPVGQPVESPALGTSELRFLIRDPRGLTPAGIGVELRAGSGEIRRAEQRRGEVIFEGLSAGRYAYAVTAPGRPDLVGAQAVELAVGEARVLELRLGDYELAIRGTVLAESGEPVAGLPVAVRALAIDPGDGLLLPRSRAGRGVRTAGDGSFEIPDLEAGEYEVATAASDRYLEARAVVRAGSESVVLSVVERREIRLFGLVATGGGEPLAGVLVSRTGTGHLETWTDDDGFYQLSLGTEARARAHRLSYRLEGYRSELLDLRPADLAELEDVRHDVVLELLGDSAEVIVRLEDPDGRAVAGERAHLYSPSLKTRYQAVSREDGAARFPAVQAGADYHLWVLPEGPYKSFQRRPVSLGGEAAPLRVTLEPLSEASVAGRMVDSEGYPVPRFDLWLTGADARGRLLRLAGDDQGYFETDGVPAGGILLRSRSTPEHRITGIRLAAGGRSYVEIPLDVGDEQLGGQVYDADGYVVAGATVVLEGFLQIGSVKSTSRRAARTDSRGAFSFSRLGAGPRQLRVITPGHEEVRKLESGQWWVDLEIQAPSD